MLVASYRDGMLHGTYKTFYPGTKSQISGTYFEDVKDGDWNYYSEEGELVTVIRYDKGQVLNPEELEKIYETFIKQLEETEGTIPDPALGPK
jgi:antitoxin component YwqK of YwqJK toxin-antitoxin module